jgi:hypothetical protein
VTRIRNRGKVNRERVTGIRDCETGERVYGRSIEHETIGKSADRTVKQPQVAREHGGGGARESRIKKRKFAKGAAKLTWGEIPLSPSCIRAATSCEKCPVSKGWPCDSKN